MQHSSIPPFPLFCPKPLLYLCVFNLYLNQKPNKRLTLTSFWWMKIVDTVKRLTHLPPSNWQQQQSACLISHTLPHTFINICWYYCVFITTKQERAWSPSSLRRVVDPFQQRVGLGWVFGCSLWVVGFCGSGIWPCLVISLHLSFLSLLLRLPYLSCSFSYTPRA